MSNVKELVIEECIRLADLLTNYKKPSHYSHSDKQRAEIAIVSQLLRNHTIELEKILYGRNK